MSHLFRAYARLWHTSRSALQSYRSTKYLISSSSSYSSQTSRGETEEMGKDKIQLSLKTPKGTQDCRSLEIMAFRESSSLTA